MSGYIKDFDGWYPVKKNINERANVPTFSTREIWWCSTGINVGYEQDGKNQSYERPVLVVRKFTKRLFLGVPLTSKIKPRPHHVAISFKAKHDNNAYERSFIVSQMRSFDSLRMTRQLGKLTPQQFQLVIDEIQGLF